MVNEQLTDYTNDSGVFVNYDDQTIILFVAEALLLAYGPFNYSTVSKDKSNKVHSDQYKEIALDDAIIVVRDFVFSENRSLGFVREVDEVLQMMCFNDGSMLVDLSAVARGGSLQLRTGLDTVEIMVIRFYMGKHLEEYYEFTFHAFGT